MKLAALYSGGKDSAFAMYVASQMGHEITCLVTVKPTDRASWIFHTPNLSVVPYMAEAMDLELITAESDGSEEGDMAALKTVLSGLDVEGVVAGALWSDYQWDRMNIICGELNLKFIAPLWRKNQNMLYDEMNAAGIKAIIAGVFAEGLDEKSLGMPLDSEMKSKLSVLNERYGVSIMGEGGEYESMTLDSPMHKSSLEITSSEKVMERSAGTLNVTGIRLVPKKN